MKVKPCNKINKDISVLLTAYKRPEILKQQIDAINHQTLRPVKMFLYQDGIDSYYKITFDEKILSCFDDVYLSDKNEGVWKRFEYASKIVKTKYVCVFDDDTIPGERWIENCYMSSLAVNGIYGTNGVLLRNVEDYPNSQNMINFGWRNPKEEIKQVDFVGHSWFFETCILETMINSRFRDLFKYVGEDMVLSYTAQKMNIQTFVPKHPIDDISLWGSIPSYGNRYGKSRIAISANAENYLKMGEALRSIHEDGWKLLYEINPNYVAHEVKENVYASRPDSLYRMICADLDEIISKGNKIFLYGAGKIGRLFEGYFQKRNVDIKGFIVSRKSSNCEKCEINGIPVYLLDEFLKNVPKKTTVILSLSETFHETIIESLEKLHIDIYPLNFRRYSYDDLISFLEHENV